MEIEYQSELLFYGYYQPARVVWITTLEDEVLCKLDVLDKDGRILYRVVEHPGDRDPEVIFEEITETQIQNIQEILEQNEVYYYWYEEDSTEKLGYFGTLLAQIDSVKKYTEEFDRLVILYEFYSSQKDVDTISDLEFFEDVTLEREEIEQYLIAQMLAHKEMNTITMKYFKDGRCSAYKLTLKEYNF
ncbi:hypothetical protein JZO81_05350 [Enterococcus hulanensis]|uniref:hypothetical protein n=1 Tax=Enterococcus TaxID=1350 RepID=UPI000B5AA769|nr:MULTISPECIES: hypothetical protein [Enterococcus]MBO0410469.1 hypothetical protein [Enterococcus hulanensis]OTO14354.1 hypothetical protein A5875_003511 [Enterococcus sp. 3H8_DIV0648]